MNIAYRKISQYLFLFLSVVLLFSSSPVYGSSETSDHADHQHETHSSVVVIQTDCASACINNNRSEKPTITLKESKVKEDKLAQEDTDCQPIFSSQSFKEPTLKLHLPDLADSHKLNCIFIC